VEHLDRQYHPTPGWDERKSARASRQQLLMMLAIVAALAMLSSQIWWQRVFPPDSFDPPSFAGLAPATPAQADALEHVALEYREVLIDARLTNDTSAFATYLHNDPTVETWQECQSVFETYGREIAESFYPVPDAPTYLRYAFTNIDGHWYISAMWSDCRKDTPCA
jgi:hypothetical protein